MADKGPSKAEVKKMLEEEDEAMNTKKPKQVKNGWGKKKWWMKLSFRSL